MHATISRDEGTDLHHHMSDYRYEQWGLWFGEFGGSFRKHFLFMC
jgi:hypothetical protein